MRTIVSRFFPVVALGLGLLSPGSVHAGPILQGGTEVLTTGFYLPNFMQGYDFVPTTNQSLTALGFWDEGSNGLPRSFQVGLWLTATQTLLASAVIDNADPIDPSVTIANGQYRYETLASPVALSSGTTYTLAWQVGGPDPLAATDALFLVHSSLSLDPNVTVPNQVRALGTAAFSFPTTTAVAGNFFRGNVNAQLTTTAIPEPPSFTLCGLGIACVYFVRSRIIRKARTATASV